MKRKKKEEPQDGCDVRIRVKDATADEDLPVALGAVELAVDEEDIDGCDFLFRADNATLDSELPPSRGGIL